MISAMAHGLNECVEVPNRPSGFVELIPEICSSSEAVANIPETLEASIHTGVAYRTLARAPRLPPLALPASTFDKLGPPSKTSCFAVSNVTTFSISHFGFASSAGWLGFVCWRLFKLHRSQMIGLTVRQACCRPASPTAIGRHAGRKPLGRHQARALERGLVRVWIVGSDVYTRYSSVWIGFTSMYGVLSRNKVSRPAGTTNVRLACTYSSNGAAVIKQKRKSYSHQEPGTWQWCFAG